MARTLVPGDIIRSRIVWYSANQLGQIGLHWTVLTVGTPAATDADFVTAFDGLVEALAKDVIAADIDYIGVGAQVIFPLPVQVEQTTRTNVGVGTRAALTGAKQGAALISWLTNFAGRANRGRSYLPFVPAGSYAADGELNGGYLSARSALAVAILGFHAFTVTGRGAAVQLVIKHRATFSTTDVVGYKTSAKVATQKRRGDYRRTNPVPF